MKTHFAALAATAIAAFLVSAPAQAADKGELLQDANRTVNHLKSDPSFATAARMMRGARAVYIVPRLIKGGFVFGAEGGSGVLLERTGRGWSEPKFYDMGSASFGFQAGLEKAELVFIINSTRALNGIKHGNFKLGGQGGITVATLSAGAEGAVSAHGGDMVVWTSGTGLFGGVAFNGSVITPDKELNSTPTVGPQAQALKANLASVR